MDTINLGSYTIPTSWDELTLGKWGEYVKYCTEQKEKEEDIDLAKSLEILSDIPREEILKMPVDLFEKVFENLSFIKEEISTEEKASHQVEMDGETYHINFMEKLKTHEWLDINTVLDANKFDYPTIFAILCRKVGEEYNDEFIANTLQGRVEMFKRCPVSKAFPLIGFFLTCYLKSRILSRNSIAVENLKEEVTELVTSLENLQKRGVFTTLSRWKQTMTLRKLKKSLQRI